MYIYIYIYMPFCEWQTKLTSFSPVRTNMARAASGSEARGRGRGVLSSRKPRAPDPLGKEVKLCGLGRGLGPADPYPSQAG